MIKSRPSDNNLLEDFPTSRRSEQPNVIFQAERVGTIISCPLNRRGSANDSVSSSITFSFVSHVGGSIAGIFTESMNQGTSPGVSTLPGFSFTKLENPTMPSGFERGRVPRRGSAGSGGRANGMRMSRRGSSGYGGHPPGPMTRRGSTGSGRYFGNGAILSGRRSSVGGLDRISSSQFGKIDDLDPLDDLDESGSLLTGLNDSQLDLKTNEKITMQGLVRDSMSLNHARGVPKMICEGSNFRVNGPNMESFTSNDLTLPGFPRDSVNLINEKGTLKRLDRRVDVQEPQLIKNVGSGHSNGSSTGTIFQNPSQLFPRDSVSLHHSKRVSTSESEQLTQGLQHQLESVLAMSQSIRRGMMQARNRTGKRRGCTE
ncbi:hypothetical protein ACHAXS_003237 [Conticribra weissflogii]